MSRSLAKGRGHCHELLILKQEVDVMESRERWHGRMENEAMRRLDRAGFAPVNTGFVIVCKLCSFRAVCVITAKKRKRREVPKHVNM